MAKEWWSDGALLFYQQYPQYPHIPAFGFSDTYLNQDDYRKKVAHERLVHDGYAVTTANYYEPLVKNGESKHPVVRYHNLTGDYGFAWYDEDVTSSMVTWTIADNNKVLSYIAPWYSDRNRFNSIFKELKYWAVCSDVATDGGVALYGSIYDADDIPLIPIEFICDGPYRDVCGASFKHVVHREWIATICKDQRDGQSFHTPNKEHVQMRKLEGSYGWFWLAGRVSIGGHQHFVLFCNEKDGGNKLYISAGASKTQLETKVNA